MRNSSQSGFTLTELMLAIALGMSVISSVLVGYLATYSGSLSTLANSKMSQDMTALMNIMVSDIRRAGYNSSATVAVDPASNVFSQINDTALAVFNDMNVKQDKTGTGSCILYSYDYVPVNGNGIVDQTELLGFRLNGDVVEMRTVGDAANHDTCVDVDDNNWEPLTDPDFMQVSVLTFNLAESVCLNTSEPNGDDDSDADAVADNAEEFDCYDIDVPPNPTEITVETRQVLITITANLTNDAFVEMTMTQNVRVRNDKVSIL